MKTKKVIIFLLVVIIVAFYSMAYSTVIYEEDFQNDPNWSSTDQSNIYWDDSNEYYFVKCKVEGGLPYWGYSPVFSTVSSTDVSFSFDIRPYDATWATFPQVALIQEGADTPRNEYSLRVTAHYSDACPKKFRLMASDGTGGDYLYYADSSTFDESKWYHHEITYDMSANTVTWNITERDTGESFYTTTFTDVEKIYDFNQIATGTERNEGGVDYGDWATILVDNIELSTNTGCDCSAEYQAGMQYCIDNPSACGISSSGPTDSITINSDLSFSFDGTYNSPFGDTDLTVNFKYFGEQDNKLLWELDSYTVE